MDTPPWLVESRVSLEAHAVERTVLAVPPAPGAPSAAVLLPLLGLLTPAAAESAAAVAAASVGSGSSALTASAAPGVTAAAAATLAQAAESPALAPLASTYFFARAPGSFLHWRLAPGRHVLELRRVFVANPPTGSRAGTRGHAAQAAMPGASAAASSRRVLEIHLPEPCLPDPGFFEDAATNALHIMLVTVSGTFHRIVLPFPQLTLSDNLSLENVRTYRPQLFASLERVPVLAHFVDLDIVVVACGNGSLVQINCPLVVDADPLAANDSPSSKSQKYTESLLSETSVIKSLTSIASTPAKMLMALRNGFASDAAAGASPSVSGSDGFATSAQIQIGPKTSAQQAISLASLSFGNHLIVFAFCRDSRLRVWNLLWRSCIKSILLGPASTTGYGVDGQGRTGDAASSMALPGAVGGVGVPGGLTGQSGSRASSTRLPLLPATPRSMLRVFEEHIFRAMRGSHDPEQLGFKLMCFLPQLTTGTQAAFVVFSAKLDGVGQLTEFDGIFSKGSDSDGEEFLVNFVIAKGRSSLQGGEGKNGKGSGGEDEDDEDDEDDDSDKSDSNQLDRDGDEDMDDDGMQLSGLRGSKRRRESSDDDDAGGDKVPASAWWTLWTIWDRSSATVIRFTQMSLPTTASSDRNFDGLSSADSAGPAGEPMHGLVTGKRWIQAVSPKPESVDLPELEGYQNGIPDTSNSVPEVFLEHIFEPGRFSLSSISRALAQYRRLSLQAPVHAAAHAAGRTYATLYQQVVSTVGASLRTNLQDHSAPLFFTTCESSLMAEYSKFLALVVECHQAASAPVGLCYDAATKLVVTLQSGATMGVLRVADVFEVMCWGSSQLLGTPHGAPALLLAPDHLFSGHLAPIRRKALRADLFYFVQLMEYVYTQLFTPELVAYTESEELMSRAASDFVMDDYAAMVHSRLVEEHGGRGGQLDSRLAELEQMAKSIGQLPATVACFLDALRQAPASSLPASVSTSSLTSPMRSPNHSTASLVGGGGGGMVSSSLSSTTHGFNNATLFTNDLIASATGQIIAVRHELARQAFMTLLVLGSLDLQDGGSYGVSSATMAKYLDVHSAYSRLAWIAKQQVTHSWTRLASAGLSGAGAGAGAGSGESLLRPYAGFALGRTAPAAAAGTVSTSVRSHENTTLLLHLLQHHYILDIDVGVYASSGSKAASSASASSASASSTSLAVKIVEGAESLMSRIGLFAPTEQAATRAIVVLSKKLLAYGHVGVVGELCITRARSTPAVEYIKGCVWLEMLEWDKAAASFERAVGGASTDLHLVVSAEALADGYLEYYRHVSDLFLEKGVLDIAARFARMAMSLIARSEWGQHMNTVRALNKTIFKCCVETGDFEGAFEAIQTNPDAKSQRDCLRTFVNALCDQNDLHALCAKFSFGDLAAEVERTLEFKARTFEPSLTLRTPNYHRICYAYYVFHGDYRSAALSMYTLAHKMAGVVLPSLDMPAERRQIVVQVVAEQAQCLLAALNALALVDPDQAWIAVPSSMTDSLQRFASRPGLGAVASASAVVSMARGADLDLLIEEGISGDGDDGVVFSDEAVARLQQRPSEFAQDGAGAVPAGVLALAGAGSAPMSSGMDLGLGGFGGGFGGDGVSGLGRDGDGFGTARPHPVHIVEVDDIRKQYHLALAKLKLHARFPDLAMNTGFVDPGNALTMFCQAGQFDAAFSFAAVFGLDAGRIFVSVVDKLAATKTGVVGAAVAAGVGVGAGAGIGAVAAAGGDSLAFVDAREDLDEIVDSSGLGGGLAAASAAGLGSSKWARIKPLLDQFDGEHQGFKHHLAVIKRILHHNRHEALPRWLTQPFQASVLYHTDQLVRAYLENDRLLDAARLALQYVKEHIDALPQSMRAATGTRWLSLTMVEHVVRALELAGSLDEWVHRLRQSVQVYLGTCGMESQQLLR
ncbi:hypothetical protein HK105_200345 [Polyrhizophydium stewartii]|uniref:Nuclear pore complex protein Nup160 n=1 Tax=Polyrhizophydium stewartii TaxID=2732419 RepID=A0ABR4NL64_9FUNG